MSSNRIVLIFIFIAVGYFLVYRDKPGPLADMFTSVKKVFSVQPSEKENPYKAKEKPGSPRSETSVIDDVSDKAINKAEEKITDFFDNLGDRLLSKEATSGESKLPEAYFPISAKKLEIVRHKALVLAYDETHEQAAWTFHQLTNETIEGDASRNGLSFIPDEKITTSSALSSDYTNSGFDRGHLVPAGDFKCCQDLLQDTFWVSNIVPQNSDCNRNIWNSLEQQVRNWVKRQKRFYVFTGPVLASNLPKIGKDNRISVPTYLYKIVVLPDVINPANTQVKAFLIPNEGGLGYKFAAYATTVDTIEKATGLDFLAILPDDIENKIEQKIATVRW